MIKSISIAEARKNFAEITAEATHGAEIMILKNGKEYVKIVAPHTPVISPDIKALFDEVANEFEYDLTELASR